MESTVDMETVRDELFAEVGRVYKETKTLPDAVLSALHFMFPGNTLVQALDLVENRNVSKLISPSGRVLFQVIGSTGTPYACFSTSNYCGCSAYRYAVLKRAEQPMCKHRLAIRLCEAMGLTKEQQVSNEELTSTIKTI